MILFRRMLLIISYTISICVIWSGASFASDIQFELRITDKEIRPGRQTYCEAVIDGDVPAPSIPFVKDLSISYIKSRKEVNATVFVYRVVGRKEGAYTIGPIAFKRGDDMYISNEVILNVTTKAASEKSERVSSGSDMEDIGQHCYLTLEAPKKTVFVNERLPVSLNFYSDRSCIGLLSQCRIESDNLIISVLHDEANRIVTRDGRDYELASRHVSVVAPTDGRFVIKPVTMRVSAGSAGEEVDVLSQIKLVENLAKMNNSDLYDDLMKADGRVTRELRTDPLYLTVLPLPDVGVPAGFNGAIGSFSMKAGLNIDTARAGEMIRITAKIEGDGNYNTVRAPSLRREAGIHEYTSDSEKGEDYAVFTKDIIIQSPDVRQIPKLEFSFFDPDKREYVTLTAGPFPIKVASGGTDEIFVPAVQGDVDEAKAWMGDLKSVTLPLQRRGEPFYRGILFVVFELLPLFIVFFGIIIYEGKRYLLAHPFLIASFAASRLAASRVKKAKSILGKAPAKEFYAVIFRTLQEYLGARRLIPSEGITSNIINEIDDRAIDADVMRGIKSVFCQCYAALYTDERFAEERMRGTLDALVSVIDKLNKRPEL